MLCTVSGTCHCMRSAICVTRTPNRSPGCGGAGAGVGDTWVVWRALHRVRLATACAQTCLMPLWEGLIKLSQDAGHNTTSGSPCGATCTCMQPGSK